MGAATLTVELFTEELPPKALKALGEAFADRPRRRARRARLPRRAAPRPRVSRRRGGSPRRVTHVRAVAPDAEITEKLMPAKVALGADGQPSQAFAKKMAGLSRAHLATASLDAADGPDRVFVQSDGKADYVYLRTLAQGRAARAGAAGGARRPAREAADPQGHALPAARRLLQRHRVRAPGASPRRAARQRRRAGHGTRPRRRQPSPTATASSAAHDLAIASADAYASTLEAEGKVVPSFDAAPRRHRGRRSPGPPRVDRVIMPDALLDEVTALVEWPVVYAGTFDPRSSPCRRSA